MSDKEQKGFIVYGDTKAVVDELTDEQVGKLFRGMLDYFVDGTEPEFSDVLKFVFIPIRQQMDRNSDKYVKMCDRNKKNAKKRWDASGCDRMHSDAVDANTDTSTGTDKGTGTDIVSPEQSDSISLSLISYLNQKTGGTYTDTEQTRELIESRLSEGYTEEDLRTVIDKKAIEWNCSGNMRSNLRPSVLFGEKFEEYLNAPVPMEVERVREKSDKAAKLRTDLDANRDELEQVESRMEEIKNETGSEELKDLRFRKAYLEEVIENMMRRLEVT